MTDLRAPFPWFGGKSVVAPEVWSRFGDVPNYVEPFVGSAACLLSRPSPSGIETINDADGLLTNFWRAIRFAPEAVAEHADWPVSECDLHARHAWLVGQRGEITGRLMGTPDYFDVKAAGWWVWGISSWIGSGWCSGQGPWIVIDGALTDSRQLPHLSEGKGINRKLPHLSEGKGINRKLPHLSGDQGIDPQAPAPGVSRQIPNLRGDSGAAGLGINRKLPAMDSQGRADMGIRRPTHRDGLLAYFDQLASRLRDVRVACGDFERVLGPSITSAIGTTAIFLDPPYDSEAADCHDAYSAKNAESVADRARIWAIANGANPSFRIALAGYLGEHDTEMLAAGWTAYNWKARGGYGNQGDGRGRENAKREVIWFSPHCIKAQQERLFA